MRKKHLLIILSILMSPMFGVTQQTINGSITHDAIQRDYILYVPANYTGNTSVPLIFNFHGYTSNANDQMWYGDFRSIADTAGFILVHPQGTLFQGNTHWNVGGWTLGSTTDDVGFTSDLIDSISANYNIDLSRVYSTGMSNGGFMSFLLACQLSNKIAAIASVTGSMTPQTINGCNPQHSTPILQIHGTVDGTVPYTGDTWTEPIIDAVEYWANFNNCNMTPTITPLPDINTADLSTVEHFVYSGGDNGSTCEHFKVTGGDHTWPGTIFGGAGTNYDINASAEIWKFFSRYDINGLISSTGINPQTPKELELTIFPNPSYSKITIEGNFSEPLTYQINSILGDVVGAGIVSPNNHQIDLTNLPPNIYILSIDNQKLKLLKTE